MKTAFFHTPLEREAYDHGRTQEQLRIARRALQEILDISSGQKRSSTRAIAIHAKLALEFSQPGPETRYNGIL